MNEVIISLKNISLSYRKKKSFFRHEYHEALKDISFDIRRGETVGIIGRNGVGKSTLLKILSGIFMPDKGTIENHSTKTSLLTLQAGFDLNLCGRDNAILSGMLLGYEKEYIYSKLKDIEEYCELGPFFREPLKSYSNGMKARLGFATATHLTPEVLLIDEVLGVGDEKFRIKATETMESMIRSDHTVILVSHAGGVMSKLCDRIIWIENGVVKDQGDPDSILKAYQSS
ncbi:MAG: lipopolysaccharide transport system ATP-binding protein [Oceanicoccus sp.]|jgi:lipopolysaccharide transport system ATP-binding protein